MLVLAQVGNCDSWVDWGPYRLGLGLGLGLRPLGLAAKSLAASHPPSVSVMSHSALHASSFPPTLVPPGDWQADGRGSPARARLRAAAHQPHGGDRGRDAPRVLWGGGGDGGGQARAAQVGVWVMVG